MIEWDGTSDFQDFPRVNSNSLKLLALAEKMVFGIVIGYDAGRYYTGSGGSFPLFLSNGASIPSVVTFTSQVSINPNESIQSVESPPYWSYLIPIVVGIVALASIIRVTRKKSHR
jgi:hypothetical protein